MNLIETWMLSLRHKEEIQLLENEMVTFLTSLRQKISNLESEREKLNCELLSQKKKHIRKQVFANLIASSVNLKPFIFQNNRCNMAKAFLIYEEIKRLNALLSRAHRLFKDDLDNNEEENNCLYEQNSSDSSYSEDG